MSLLCRPATRMRQRDGAASAFQPKSAPPASADREYSQSPGPQPKLDGHLHPCEFRHAVACAGDKLPMLRTIQRRLIEVTESVAGLEVDPQRQGVRIDQCAQTHPPCSGRHLLRGGCTGVALLRESALGPGRRMVGNADAADRPAPARRTCSSRTVVAASVRPSASRSRGRRRGRRHLNCPDTPGLTTSPLPRSAGHHG